MKVTCPGCQTVYRIADDRLNGRRGKVRCKRCGDSFLVEPSRPSEEVYARRSDQGRARDTDLFAGISTAGADEENAMEGPATSGGIQAPLVGERNESSVLFSLAALSKQTPATQVRPADSSALIDLRALTMAATTGENRASLTADIANLGGGGAFAPLFAPPATFTPSEPEAPTPRPGGRAAWMAMALGVVATAAAAVVVVVVVRSRPSAPEIASVGRPTVVSAPAEPRAVATPPVSDMPPVPSPPVAVATTAKRSASANVAPARPVASLPEGSHAVAARAASAAASAASAASDKCCAGESEMACRMRLAAGAACGGETSAPVFDRLAATRALGLDVASCKRADGPTGAGHAKVTFQPNGTVSAVEVDAPYAGTPTGACIAQRYRRGSVPAFSGGPLTVGKNFVVE